MPRRIAQPKHKPPPEYKLIPITWPRELLELAAELLKPERPCWACKGTKFYQTGTGKYQCARCHPNSMKVIDFPDLKEEKIERLKLDTA